MPITLAEVRTEIKRRAGDKSTWSFENSDIDAEIKRALATAWPYFFVLIYDETSFTSTNLIASNTRTLTVPAAFLTPLGGEIFALLNRNSNGATANPDAKYVRITKGWTIDPLTRVTPKIYFTEAYDPQSEIILVGGVPITPPTLDTHTIPPTLPTGADTYPTEKPGFTDWLIEQTVSYLHMGRSRNNQLDPDNHFVLSQINQQLADRLRGQYKFHRPYYTLRRGYGGR
jgi:hypothetical protein